MTRGPEQGRPPEQILAEARVLADQGCKEITLIGQTVNSYKHTSGGRVEISLLKNDLEQLANNGQPAAAPMDQQAPPKQ